MDRKLKGDLVLGDVISQLHWPIAPPPGSQSADRKQVHFQAWMESDDDLTRADGFCGEGS